MDVHAHMVPPRLPELLAASSSFDVSVTRLPDNRVVVELPRHGTLGPARPIFMPLMDRDAATARLDIDGIDVALTSPWVDLIGIDVEPEKSHSWTRFFNEAMLEATSDYPRLAPLAAVPVQSPRVAEEIEWAQSVGFIGGAIGTMAVGHDLDGERFNPLWDAADALSFPLFMHPSFHGDDPRLVDGRAYGVANSVGRANDTSIALARLILAGVVHRHPGLALIGAHGGGSLPYLMGRLDRVREINPEVPDPYTVYRHLYFDSIVMDADALRFLVATAGETQIMLGSDYPFPNGDPTATKRVSAALSGPTLDLVLGGNARRVFRID